MRRTPFGLQDRSDEDEARRIAHLRSLTPEQRWYIMVRLNEGIWDLRKQTEHLRNPKSSQLSESSED